MVSYWPQAIGATDLRVTRTERKLLVEANQHKRADTGGSAGREIGVTLQVIEATHLSHLRLFGQLKFQHCPPSMAGRVPSVQSSQSAPHLIIADSLPLAQVLWRQHWRPTRPNVIIELFHFYNHDLLPVGWIWPTGLLHAGGGSLPILRDVHRDPEERNSGLRLSREERKPNRIPAFSDLGCCAGFLMDCSCNSAIWF